MSLIYLLPIFGFIVLVAMIGSFFLGIYAVHLASMRNSESNEPFLFKNGKILKVVDVLSDKSWDCLGEFNEFVNQAFEEMEKKENEENITSDGER